MPGFGHGPFGHNPFGEWDWGENVLYGYFPELDKSQDAQLVLQGQNFNGIGPLQAFTQGLIPSFDLLRHDMRNFLDLRDAYEARTQYDTLTLLTLGPRILPPETIEQQGIDGRVNQKLLFVAPSARFQSTDLGNQIQITGSSIPGNNRTVTITAVIGLTTARTTPFLEFDNGPLNWLLVQPQASSTTQTTFEIEYGDPSQVNPNWAITDGRGLFTVVARKMLSSVTDQGGQDGVLVSGGNVGVFETPSGVFLPKDYGKFITISDSIYPQNNGRYQITQVIPGSPTQVLLSRGLFSNIFSVLNDGINTTIVTTANHGLISGQEIILSGVADPMFNGQFNNVTVITPTEFQFPQTFSQYQLSTGGVVLVTETALNPIEDLVANGTTLTVTTENPTGLLEGDTVSIEGTTPYYLDGNLNWTNGSTTVTGVGTSFLSQVFVGQYVKQALDPNASFAQVANVGSNTTLTLVHPYIGNTANLVPSVASFDGVYLVTVLNTLTQFQVPIPIPITKSSSGGFAARCFSTSDPVVSLSGNGTTLTVTTLYPNNLSVGSIVLIQGALNPAFNGLYTVSHINSTTSFDVPNPTIAVSSGGVVSTMNGIVDALNDGVNTTVTTTNQNSFNVGEGIIISGTSNYNFNGYFPVAAVISDTIFSVILSQPSVRDPAGLFISPGNSPQLIEQISNNGTISTVILPTALTVYGTFSAVTQAGPASTATITPSGTPLSEVSVTVLIVSTTAVLGTGLFTYSVNGSNYYFTPIAFAGTGTGTLATTGTPYPTALASYAVQVIIQTPGAVGTATFTYSLYGGLFPQGPFTTSTSYVVSGAGFNLNFSAIGTFNIGDTWTFQATGPYQVPATGAYPVSTIAYESTTPLGITLGFAIGLGQQFTAGATYSFSVGPTNITIRNDANPLFNGIFAVNPVNNTTVVTFAQTLSAPLTVPGGQIARVQGLVQQQFQQDPGPLTWALLPRALITINNAAPAIIGWVERFGSDLQILLSEESISSVTSSGSGTATLTPSGTPSGAFEIVLQITTSGIAGTAFLAYSLDNGHTFSYPPLLIPTVPGFFTIPEVAIQVYSSVGSYHSGDTYSFETSGNATSIVFSPTAMFDVGIYTPVVHTGIGTGALAPSGIPLVTFQGTESVSYGIVVTITTSGGSGAGAFYYSLNGSATSSRTIPLDGFFEIPETGILLSFTGSFMAGDTYSFNSTASGDVGKLLTIRGTVTQDGTYAIDTLLDAQHAVLAANLTLQVGQFYWEIRTATNVGDGTQVQTNAPSLLAFLAEDFGIQISAQEPENLQQAYVGNVTRWLDFKGVPSSYTTLGAMTGYDVAVEQLWRIPQDYGQNPDALPTPAPLIGQADFFAVGDAQPGHDGTDGFLIFGPDSQVQFGSPTLQLAYRDIGSQILISGGLIPGNNKLYTIENLVVASFGGKTLFPGSEPASESLIEHIGTGTGTLSLSGYTTVYYQFVIRIDPTLTGSPVASFAYSIDGGSTFSGDQSIVTGIPFPLGTTGISVTFSGGFVVNDTYSVSPLLAAEFRAADVTPDVVVPDPNNSIPPASLGLNWTHGLQWSLVRTYTDFQPLLALFDEINPDLLTQILDSFFSAVTHTGAGTGTVTPGGIVVPPISPATSWLIVVTIVSSGPVGTGTFSYTVNGTPFPVATIPSTPVLLGASGVLLTFTGTFTAIDTYSFDAVYTDAFSLDKYSWESNFNAQVKITVLSTLQINSTTWQITVQGGMQNGANYPNSPQVVLGVGHWALRDTSAATYYLETVPQLTLSGYYTFNILSGVSPVLGKGYLQLFPGVQPVCGYCGSYKIYATVEKTENFPKTNLAIEQSQQRLLTRLGQTLPEHAALVATFIDNLLFAELNIRASITTGEEIQDLYAPVTAYFDESPSDVTPIVLLGGTYPVSHVGLGTGVITAQTISVGGQSFSVYSPLLITITTSGSFGVGHFTYSINGGPASATQVIPTGAVFVIPATGLQVTFKGTFTATDTYSISTGTVSIATLGTSGEAIALQITTFGSVGVGQLRYSTNGGNTYSAPTTITPTLILGDTTLAFNAVNGEGYGLTTISTGPYAHTVTLPAIVPSTVTIYEQDSIIATDDGAGNITGAGIAGGGTVNYATGMISFSFTSPPVASLALTVNYTTSAGTFTTGNYYSLLVGAVQATPIYGPATSYTDIDIYASTIGAWHLGVFTPIAGVSMGQTLPQGTINVVSTAAFPSSGTFEITTTTGLQTVSYTGKTGTSFTTCTGGTGLMQTSATAEPVTGDVALIGTPAGNFDFVFAITGSGAPGTATFTYTINNDPTTTTTGTIPVFVGSNQYSVLALASPATGLSFLFTGTNYLVGDAYVLGNIPVITYTPFTPLTAPGTIIPVGNAPSDLFNLTITTSGSLGVAVFSYTINGGVPVTGQTVPSPIGSNVFSVYTESVTGIGFVFAGSFVLNDTYSFRVI